MENQIVELIRNLNTEIRRINDELADAYKRLTECEKHVIELDAENELLINTIKYLIYRYKDKTNVKEKDMQELSK